MRRFNQLVVSIASAIVLLSPGLVDASHFWDVKMSDPTTSDQVRTFNIEYVALTTLNSDKITVKLQQNGASIATDITKKGGDSGVFKVNVPSDGSYTYKLTATSSDDGSTRSTTAKQVQVTTPEGASSSDVEVTDADTTTGDQTGGVVAGETDQPGQVGENGATTDKDNQPSEGDQLGEQTTDSTDNTIWAILAAIAILLTGYYWFFYRQGKTLFNKDEE
jgi:hypothetical protein